MFYTEDEADVIDEANSIDVPVVSDDEINGALSAKKYPVSLSLLNAKAMTDIRRLNFRVGDRVAYVRGRFPGGMIQQSQFASQGITFTVSTSAPYYIFEIE